MARIEILGSIFTQGLLMLSFMKIHSSLKAAFYDALPALIVSVILSTSSGLANLAALWFAVKLIVDPDIKWVGLMTLFWTASALLSAFASWLSHVMETTFSGKIREIVANHLVRLPAGKLAEFKREKLKQLLVEDIEALHHMMAHLPAEFVTFLVIPVISVVILIKTAGAVVLLTLVPGLLAILVYLIVVPKLAARNGELMMGELENMSTVIQDYSQGAAVFRIYDERAGALYQYKSAASRFTDSIAKRVGSVATVVAIATALLQAVGTYAIVYSIGYDWPVEVLAIVLLFSLALVTPALKLGHGLDYVASGRNALKRIDNCLKQPELIGGDETLEDTEHFELTISGVIPTVGDVCRIRPLNVTFFAGQVGVITGRSGSGKSTLLRLIAGFETLKSGEIVIAGRHVEHLNPLSRQQSILLIPQSRDVLPCTIADNLALTAPDADEKAMQRALQRARLNKSLNTSAQSLSGGEAQRVNIARSFLSEHRIVLLDEPTSALERSSAMAILAELKQEANDKQQIIVIVTHDNDMASQGDVKLSMNDYYLEGVC